MGNVAISVEGLGKRYRIASGPKEPYGSLRESMVRAAQAPLWRLRRGERRPDAKDMWALRDVSFDVKHGEAVGIIGRNGAGKSTLLKVLSRITEPTAGRAVVHGRVGSLLEVGTGFHPELTGRENIYLNGAVMGMSRAEIKRHFDEIVDFSGVEQFLDTPVKRYSSGMYMRLAFAVAAHLEPEVLVVDEVLAVGDAEFQKKCLGKMSEVARGGRTVLFVSHNMSAVQTLCARAVLLQGGELRIDDSAKSTVGKYLSEIRNSVLVRSWQTPSLAPQNGIATLLNISVRGERGEVLDVIDTDTPFRIEIEYAVKLDGAHVGLTVMLLDAEQSFVFSSINNHEQEWYGKPMNRGKFRSICHIPGRLLNNGWFSLSINIFGPNFSDSCMVQDVLRFEILDGAEVRGDYYGAFAGVIRPLLQWVTIPMIPSNDDA